MKVHPPAAQVESMLSSFNRKRNHRQLFVRGTPRPKPRQTQRDRFAPSNAVQAYRFWADTVRIAWQGNFPGEPWEGGVYLSIIFGMPIPRSWNDSKTARAVNGDMPHTSPPDLDNLIKGVADALNKVAWRDDCQIIGYLDPTSKTWAPIETAGAWITVEYLP